jgi:hypothetical protein
MTGFRISLRLDSSAAPDRTDHAREHTSDCRPGDLQILQTDVRIVQCTKHEAQRVVSWLYLFALLGKPRQGANWSRPRSIMTFGKGGETTLGATSEQLRQTRSAIGNTTAPPFLAAALVKSPNMLDNT